jgi:hypothetical protein
MDSLGVNIDRGMYILAQFIVHINTPFRIYKFQKHCKVL